MGDNFKFGYSSSKHLKTVNPILQELAKKTIAISEVDFGILKSGALRTAEEQNKLYQLGYSKCDGYKKKSYHQSGLAVDFIPYIDGLYTWADKEAFKKINKAVIEAWESMDYKNEYKLIWGGNWKTFVDMPHYELRKIKKPS